MCSGSAGVCPRRACALSVPGRGRAAHPKETCIGLGASRARRGTVPVDQDKWYNFGEDGIKMAKGAMALFRMTVRMSGRVCDSALALISGSIAAAGNGCAPSLAPSPCPARCDWRGAPPSDEETALRALRLVVCSGSVRSVRSVRGESALGRSPSAHASCSWTRSAGGAQGQIHAHGRRHGPRFDSCRWPSAARCDPDRSGCIGSSSWCSGSSSAACS